jgi:hypothetical protein
MATRRPAGSVDRDVSAAVSGAADQPDILMAVQAQHLGDVLLELAA